MGMTLPWVLRVWKAKQREKAANQLAALDAAALGSAAKYGGQSGRAFRKRANDLLRAIETK